MFGIEYTNISIKHNNNKALYLKQPVEDAVNNYAQWQIYSALGFDGSCMKINDWNYFFAGVSPAECNGGSIFSITKNV